MVRHKCSLMELFKPEKTAYKEAAIAAAPPLYSAAAETARLAHSSLSTSSISINLIINLFHHFQPHTSHMILLPNMYIPMSFLFDSNQSLTSLNSPPPPPPLFSDPLYKLCLFLHSSVLPTFSALQTLSIVLAPRLLSGILILIIYYLFYLYLTKSIYLAEWVASQAF